VIAVAAGVAVLLVPTAVATKSLWSPAADSADPDHPVRPTAPVELTVPKAPNDAWRLSVSETNVGLCLHTYIAGAGLGQGCSPHVTAANPLLVQTGAGTRDGYVLGSVVPSARTLRVVAGGQVRTVRAFSPDPERLRLARIPADFKLFVAFFPVALLAADNPGVSVVAHDASGKVVGRYPRR
jgi:hypothetical protein